MPFKSKAQKKWMMANKPEMAKQWAKDTPRGTKLPQKIGTKISGKKKK